MRDVSAARPTVCLLSALTVADFIDFELVTETHSTTGAQLGILTLAAILRKEGFSCQVVNLDDLFLAFLKEQHQSVEGEDGRNDEFFLPFVVEHLKTLRFDVFGLSTICSSYPLTLRLAAEIKKINPKSKVVLGGPQASVVDVPTMKAFPCIDFIVRGEADETFHALLMRLATNEGNWENLQGITFRRGDQVVRNANAPVVTNLDALPLPALDLDPHLRKRGGIHLEIGRGCPFACTFCSTNDFFRRNFRLKSPGKMIEEISFIKKEYGINYFSLVHDMYTVDRRKVIAFCEAVRESGEMFTWGCSARTDCIDDDLIRLMGEAGCRGIFFGIETGSQRLQHVIKKNLDLKEAVSRIAFADRCGIDTTVALIVGFPEETRDDLRDTIHFFIDSIRFDHAEPQCSLLAPLAATPIQEQHKDELVYDDLVSDMSQQGWRQDPLEVEMIKSYPDIFPNFYSIPALLDRRYVKEVLDFVTYLATWFRWLPVALLQDSGDVLAVFDRWTAWRSNRSQCDTDEDLGRTPYYSHRRFRSELLEFVKSCYIPEMAAAPAAISAVLAAESLLFSPRHPADRAAMPEVELNPESVPRRSEGLFMLELDVDYSEVIKSLRAGVDLRKIAERQTTVVFTPLEKQTKVWKMSPLSLQLLALCDGRRSISEIARELSMPDGAFDGIPLDQVCIFGLNQLCKDGLLEFSSEPVEEEDETSYEPVIAEPTWRLPTSQTTNNQQPWPPRSATV